MRHMLGIVAAIVIGAGCGGATCPPGAASVPTSSTDPVVARTMEQERVTCACKTLMCAATAETEMKAWVKERHDQVEQTLADPLREAQIDAHKGRTDGCHQVLYDAATPAEREAAEPDLVVKALAAMSGYADRLCACKDRPCAEQVLADMSKIEDPKAKPTKEQMEQAIGLAQQMAACQKQIMGAEEPPPTP